MHDPKNEKPVRQPELPKKGEPVQPQPANDRPVGGQGVVVIRRAKLPPHCLTRNVTGQVLAMTGETTPNRFGVVNGETNQHGRTA
jgi:hypothetical protein